MQNLVCFLLLLLFSVISHPTLSQNERYIEVTVSDTVSLKVSMIYFMVEFGGSVEFMGVKVRKPNDEGDSIPTIEQFRELMDKHQFKYSIPDIGESAENIVEDNPSFLFEFKTNDELIQLKRLIKPFNGISGRIDKIIYEDLEKYEYDLYKRLYKKARRKADMLASISGNHTGKVLSISDLKGSGDSLNDLMGMYRQVFRNLPASFGIDQTVSDKEEVFSLVYKFELK